MAKQQEEIKVTTEAAKEDTPVSKAQFNQLQESYRKKCLEYDRLLNAYKALAMRYTNAGETAKQFIKTAYLGINLIFPDDQINQGEN